MRIKILLLATFIGAVVLAEDEKAKKPTGPDAEFEEIFKIINEDGNESISKDEMIKYLKSFKKEDPTDSDVDDLIKYFDKDGDGAIKVDEFLTGIKNSEKGSNLVDELKNHIFMVSYNLDESHLKEWNTIFDSIDKDKDGKISKDEMDADMKPKGLKQEAIDGYFEFADIDKDGSLNRVEFFLVVSEKNVRASGLKKHLLQVMKPLSEEEKNHYKVIFDELLDENKDGKITADELEKLAKNIGLYKYQVEEMMTVVDQSNDGSIDFDEFVKAFVMTAKPAEYFVDAVGRIAGIYREEVTVLVEKFKEFDKNGDEKLSEDELQAVVESLGMKASESDIKDIMKNGDQNRDGAIDVKELYTMLNDSKTLPVNRLRAYIYKEGFGISDESFAEFKSDFEKIDLKKKGYVKKEDFNKIKEHSDPDSFSEVFTNTFDKNGDGIITLREFIQTVYEFQVSMISLGSKLHLHSDYEKLFNWIDTESDGEIKKEVFTNFLKEEGIEDKVIEEIFTKFDKNGDGTISQSEFGDAMDQVSNESHIMKQLVKKKQAEFDEADIMETAYYETIFSLLDITEDGLITHRDLKETLKVLKLEDSHIEEIMNFIDVGSDGFADKEEFLFMMRYDRTGKAKKVRDTLWECFGFNRETLEETSKLFVEHDTDNDGKLKKDQLLEVLASYGIDPTESNFKEIMRTTDGSENTEYNATQVNTVLMQINRPLVQKLVVNLKKHHRGLAIKTREHLTEIFNLFDTNGDGKINEQEILESMKSAGKLKDDVAFMIKRVDKNNDGFVDLDEFLNAMTKRDIGADKFINNFLEELGGLTITETAVLAKTFTKFDDGDKKLSKDELKKVFESFELQFSDEEVTQIMTDADHDKNDSLDLDEFLKMMAFIITSDDVLVKGRNILVSAIYEIDEENLKGIEEFEKLFQHFDADENGQLSLDELKEMLKSFGIKESDASEIMSAADEDGDGSLSYKEFHSLITKGKEFPFAEELTKYAFMAAFDLSSDEYTEFESTFKKLDTDDNGGISKSELEKAFKENGLEISDEDISKLVTKADLHQDGVISFEEMLELALDNDDETDAFKKLVLTMTYGITKDDYTKYSEEFDKIDTNDDYRITKEELPELLKKLGKDPADEKVATEIGKADRDKDDKIEFHEFLNLMSQIKG